MGLIAVFGGTFNPFHIGHGQILDELVKLSEIEKVILMPTKIPPHKQVDYLENAEHRFNMCGLIAENYANVEVCDLELRRLGKSYTIDTVNELKRLYPDKRIAITIGADMVVTFDEWKSYRELIANTVIITFYRKNIPYDKYIKSIDRLRNCGATVIMLTENITDISSTEIRKMLKNGEDVSEVLNSVICEYIKSNYLFGDCNAIS